MCLLPMSLCASGEIRFPHPELVSMPYTKLSLLAISVAFLGYCAVWNAEFKSKISDISDEDMLEFHEQRDRTEVGSLFAGDIQSRVGKMDEEVEEYTVFHCASSLSEARRLLRLPLSHEVVSSAATDFNYSFLINSPLTQTGLGVVGTVARHWKILNCDKFSTVKILTGYKYESDNSRGGRSNRSNYRGVVGTYKGDFSDIKAGFSQYLPTIWSGIIRELVTDYADRVELMAFSVGSTSSDKRRATFVSINAQKYTFERETGEISLEYRYGLKRAEKISPPTP